MHIDRRFVPGPISRLFLSLVVAYPVTEVVTSLSRLLLHLVQAEISSPDQPALFKLLYTIKSYIS
jgi:hypothetical protein